MVIYKINIFKKLILDKTGETGGCVYIFTQI